MSANNLLARFGVMQIQYQHIKMMLVSKHLPLSDPLQQEQCTITLPCAEEESRIKSYFEAQWCLQKGDCPHITSVLEVTNSHLNNQWDAYRETLPFGYRGVEMHFHGTKLKCDIAENMSLCNDRECGICNICKTGMSRDCIQKNITFLRFGRGFYFVPKSSKGHDYTQGFNTYRAQLLVDVLPGRKRVLYKNNEDLCCPPPGHQSVYGRSGITLNYDELTIYDPNAVRPRYIIVYTKDGVGRLVHSSYRCYDR